MHSVSQLQVNWHADVPKHDQQRHNHWHLCKACNWRQRHSDRVSLDDNQFQQKTDNLVADDASCLPKLAASTVWYLSPGTVIIAIF